MTPRYSGQFYGQHPFHAYGEDRPDGTPVRVTTSRVWTVTIFTDEDTDNPEDLDFDADSPLAIEWDETAPEDVFEGSTATIRVISPSFLHFSHLYTTDPSAVILEVKAGSDIVWRGTLEPELYAEPYAEAAGYTVELTFVDLAPIERRDFDGSGLMSLDAIIKKALAPTAFDGYTLMSATTHNTGAMAVNTPIAMADLTISADNFYDEDGEAMNLHDAVETILRPLALRIRQWGGRLWIYDWHSIRDSHKTGDAAEWTSTDATMEIAPVAHKITLTYSPYADTTIATGEVDGDELGDGSSVSGHSLTVNTDYGDNPVYGFEIKRYAPNTKALSRGFKTDNQLFRIIPGHSGSECAGILGHVSPRDGVALSGGTGVPITQRPKSDVEILDIGGPVATLTGSVLTGGSPATDYIKITVDFLLDVRYNPYEEAAKDNEEGNWDRLQNWANFGYIPVALELINNDGKPVAHYRNSNVKASNKADGVGEWVAGGDTPGDMWLAYYDPTDRKSKSGWGGWKKNRQCIGYWRNDLPALYEKRGEGEYIRIPDIDQYGPGRLRLTVYAGIDWFDFNREGEGSASGILNTRCLADRIRWALYGEMKMEIVHANGTAIDIDDIIYTATAIAGAASDVEVTLDAGTAVDAPTARAVFLHHYGDRTKKVTTFMRAGRSGSAAQLLLNTLCSQYDQPHLILKGEMDAAIALASEPRTWSEADSGDRRFVPTAVNLDAATGTAQATLREISPDSYHPNEE